METQALYERTLKTFFEFNKEEPPKRMENMTIGEKGILRFLKEKYPNPIFSGDFSTHLNVGTGRIGNALKSLESKGFIYRVVDHDDRRKVLVYLTDEGKEKIEEKERKLKEFIFKVIEEVGNEKYEQILDSFELFRITIMKVEKEMGE